MTDALPAPLIGPNVDLRNYPFTPMFRARLFGSSFHARTSDAEWRAGVTLWLKSWDQAPAGSLPDDDIDLCRLAELGRDLKTWRKVKEMALHGWFKCSDGRLYHSVVAEGVTEAWQGKLAQRDRTEKARATKLAKHQSQTASLDVTDGKNSVTGDVTNAVTASNRERKGERKGDKERKTLSRETLAEFEKFWSVCPKKVGKTAVLKAFVKARKVAELPDLIAAMERYAVARHGEDPQYTKHPSGWLNGGHWQDEFVPVAEVNGTSITGNADLDARILKAQQTEEKRDVH